MNECNLILSKTLANGMGRPIKIKSDGFTYTIDLSDLCECYNMPAELRKAAFKTLQGRYAQKKRRPKGFNISLDIFSFPDWYQWPTPVPYEIMPLIRGTIAEYNPSALAYISLDRLLAGRRIGFAHLNSALLKIEDLFFKLEESSKSQDISTLNSKATSLKSFPECQHLSNMDLRFGRMIRIIDPDQKGLSKALSELISTSKNIHMASQINRLKAASALHDQLSLTRAMALAEEVSDISNAISHLCYGSRLNEGKSTPNDITRNATILSMRYGVNGHNQSTLQEIANQFGMTRERVRQICDKHLESIKGYSIFCPSYSRVIEQVEELLPLSVDKLDKETSDLLGSQMSTISAQKFGQEVLGRPFPGRIEEIGFHTDKEKVMACSTASLWLKSARSLSIKHIRHEGAASTHIISATLSEQLGIPITPRQVGSALSSKKGFEWLDHEKLWFWYGIEGPKNNRIVNSTLKLLNIAKEPLELIEIWEAVARHLYSHGTSRAPSYYIPPHAFHSICSRLKDVKVIQSNKFSISNPSPEILSGFERQIFNYFAQRKGIACRRELTRDLVNTNITPFNTLMIFLSYSQLIRRITRSIYSLRGWPIDPDRFSDASQAIRTIGSTSSIKVTRIDDANFIIYAPITKGNANNRMISLPAEYEDHIPPGTYNLISDSQTSSIRLGNNRTIHGVITAGLQIGLSIGDTIECEINTLTMDAFIF